MRQAVEPDDADRAIKSAIYERIDRSVVADVSMASRDDATGEPSLFVTVSLKSGRDRPDAGKAIDMVKAMRDALFDLGDERFPYLSFRAPGDEEAEDTRPDD